MNMTRADQTNYPKMAEYLKHEFPKLTQNHLIVQNLKTRGKLTEAQIEHALSWGTRPMIKIVDMQVQGCGPAAAGAGLYGCTRGKVEIEVAKRVVAGFEATPRASMSATSTNLNVKGQHVYVLGATLLHELCHWGRNLNGVAEPQEMGTKFENAVYGKTIW